MMINIFKFVDKSALLEGLNQEEAADLESSVLASLQQLHEMVIFPELDGFSKPIIAEIKQASDLFKKILDTAKD